MKKAHVAILVALTFILGTMFGGSALAYKAVAVFINGDRLDDTGSMAMIYNDRVFVPLRLVSESLGATVGWDAEHNSAYIATQRDALTDIEIVGTDEFKKAMTDSLKLLKEKAPEEYLLAGKYIKRIELNSLTKHTYMSADEMTMFVPEGNFSPDIIWWASGIVHEAVHSRQAYDATGQDKESRELEAGNKDLEMLIKLNAPDRQIGYMEEQLKTKWWIN